MLQRLILIHMEDDSDLDTSESEDESDQESVPESDGNTDDLPRNLKPELSQYTTKTITLYGI
jgi:hypothetical protein